MKGEKVSEGVFGIDDYSPKEIAAKVEAVGVSKANLPLLSMVALGILAGGFIGLGALYFTVVTADPELGFAASRMLGGVAFSLGLILVIIAGAELFTGNNLLVMAWVAKRISGIKILRDFVIIYIANFVGALGLVFLVLLSGHLNQADGLIAERAIAIAMAKAQIPFVEAFFRGVLCNILVCLAIWLAMAGRNIIGKITAIIFPVSAFVAAGFEHCVANMYFIPLGILAAGEAPDPSLAPLAWSSLAHNLIPVTLGNLLGGSVMVGLVFWAIYRRNRVTSM